MNFIGVEGAAFVVMKSIKQKKPTINYNSCGNSVMIVSTGSKM